MRLKDLIEELEGIRDEFGDEMKVYIGLKQKYSPLAFNLVAVTVIEDVDEQPDTIEGQEPNPGCPASWDHDMPVTVWLGSSEYHPEELPSCYAPEGVWTQN